MAKQLQIRGGTTVQHSAFTGALREITIDTDKDVVVVHDGTTVGGFPLAKQTSVDSKVTKVTSTDNAVVRFNGTTGEVQNSGVIIDDNNNVGIGTSNPLFKLDVTGEDGNSIIYRGTTNIVAMGFNTSRAYVGTISNAPFSIDTNGSERMRIDSNGNVGIGVTPSAWYTGVKSLELGLFTSINQGQGGEANFESNSHRSGATTWNYKVSGGGASRFVNDFGKFVWQTAPSGTAGNTITWNTAMTLDATGNLTLNSGTGALGYGTGGQVTQLTSKSTAVTLNKPSGTIITHAETLSGGQITYFPLINTLVSTLDTIIVNCDNGNYIVSAYTNQGNGVFVVGIANRTSVPLSDTLYISFTIIRGANA